MPAPVTADGRAARLDVLAQPDSDLTMVLGPDVDLSDYTLEAWVQTANADGTLDELVPESAAATAAMNHDGADGDGIIAVFSQADLARLGSGRHWIIVREAAGIWTVGRFRVSRTGRSGSATVVVPITPGEITVNLGLTVVAGGARAGGSLPAGTPGQVPQIGSDGETYEAKTPNTADGVLRLNGSALVPDIHLGENIVRTSEMESAIAAAVSALLDGAPGALNTLNELAAAMNDDEEFAASVTAAISARAKKWTATHAGAFGPYFDANIPGWQPEQFFAQRPNGAPLIGSASEGDQIVCAGYLGESGEGNTAQEGLWTLTGGEWVRDSAQPVPGEYVTLEPVAGEFWSEGMVFVKLADGRMELIGLQYLRELIAQAAVVEVFTVDGTLDASLSGAYAGVARVDASEGDVTVTLPAAAARVRSVMFVRDDATANVATVAAAGADTINGDPSVTLDAQWSWVTLVSDGESWRAATAATGDFQPVDADLSAIAALSTTSYGRAFLALANAAAARTAIGVSLPQNDVISLAKVSNAAIPGTPLFDGTKAATNSTTAVAAGSMLLAVGQRRLDAELARLALNVSASSMSDGQSFYFVVYELGTDGLPTGTPIVSKAHVKTTGASTGAHTTSTVGDNLRLPSTFRDYAVGVFNPSGNGSITISGAQPIRPFVQHSYTDSRRAGLQLTSLSTTPPDVTGFDVDTASDANTWAPAEVIPMVYGCQA